MTPSVGHQRGPETHPGTRRAPCLRAPWVTASAFPFRGACSRGARHTGSHLNATVERNGETGRDQASLSRADEARAGDSGRRSHSVRGTRLPRTGPCRPRQRCHQTTRGGRVGVPAGVTPPRPSLQGAVTAAPAQGDAELHVRGAVNGRPAGVTPAPEASGRRNRLGRPRGSALPSPPAPCPSHVRAPSA